MGPGIFANTLHPAAGRRASTSASDTWPVSRPYLLRRLRKQGFELTRSDERDDGSLERDVLFGPGGDRRWGGARMEVAYEGENHPQHCTLTGRDEHGWLSDEHRVKVTGRFVLEVIDSGVGSR